MFLSCNALHKSNIEYSCEYSMFDLHPHLRYFTVTFAVTRIAAFRQQFWLNPGSIRRVSLDKYAPDGARRTSAFMHVTEARISKVPTKCDEKELSSHFVLKSKLVFQSFLLQTGMPLGVANLWVRVNVVSAWALPSETVTTVLKIATCESVSTNSIFPVVTQRINHLVFDLRGFALRFYPANL